MAEDKQLDGLSFKEMRFKMCRFLEQQGIVNDLRTRLRCKFVEALKINAPSAKPSSHTLLHQVVLWLVRECLSSWGYHYTLSTLACESAVGPLALREDVAQLLHVPSEGGPLLEGMVAAHLGHHVPEEAMQLELERLRHSVAVAKQQLRAVHEQLRASARRSLQWEKSLSAPPHPSVLTQLSGSPADLLHPEALSSNTSGSRQPRSSSSPPLAATRRRLQQLALQTEYLHEKLRALAEANEPSCVSGQGS